MTDDDRELETLLAPLRDAAAGPAGPGRADVALAILAGRRRVRLRRLVGAAAVAGTTALVLVATPLVTSALRPPDSRRALPTPSSTGPTASRAEGPPRTCTVARLPVPDGVNRSVVTGIDPTGRFVLGRSYPGGFRQQVLIWDDGKPRRVDVPGDDQRLVDANSAGLAVGTSFQSDVEVAWVYTDGKVARLRGRPGTIAVAVGESGRIVGHRAFRDGTRATPLIWRSPDALPDDLPLPGGGWNGEVADIAPDGTVIGTLYRDGKRNTEGLGYLWAPDGTGRMLGLPVVDGVPATAFRPRTVDGDWITGTAEHRIDGGLGMTLTPVRVNLRTSAVETYRNDGRFVPDTPNRRGWLAGSIGNPLAENSKPAVLSSLGLLSLPSPRGLGGQVATGLSDDGRVVVGQGFDHDDRVQALIWRCR